jgi:glutaminyl-peptide cyclotransferase
VVEKLIAQSSMHSIKYFHKEIIKLILFSSVVVCLISCSGKEQSNNDTIVEEPKTVKPPVVVPQFNSDSAYAFVKQQVDFGPRIPGTNQHAACAVWLESKLRTYISEVFTQKGVATTFDQKKYEIKNIIASYKPELSNRILLCAHWDTRPFADRDEGAKKNKIFDGANDGASGVGVLIEIARQLSIAQPNIGVDIVLFDLEDYGQPDESSFPEMKDSWCLGSQYWAKNPHKPGYFAKYGILLDMVGAKNAVFPKEGVSVYYAPAVVERVWSTAAKLGYANYFIDAKAGALTDDHVYVNQLANIPCIDIIHYDVNAKDFFGHHHRVTDNMEQIDAKTLGVVGQTVLQVVFEE